MWIFQIGRHVKLVGSQRVLIWVQVNVEQLREVQVPRHSMLPLGKFSQKIDLPKPVHPLTFEVSSQAGLVIVLLEKQVCSVSKPVVL